MKETYSVYSEQLPEAFSAKYKDTEETEKKHFHLHRHLEIVLPLSDNMYCRTENGEMHIPFGSVLLISSMNLHYIVSRRASGSCRRYVIYFLPEYVIGLSTPELNLLECFLMNPSDEPRVLDIPGRLRRQVYETAGRLAEGSSEAPPEDDRNGEMRFREMENRLLLGEFLLLISRIRERNLTDEEKSRHSGHSRMVYEICEYIRQRYDRDVSLDEVAEHFYVSRTQLFYIFREVLGITMKEYIIRYRLMEAKDMLINTDLSVEMISHRVGYTQHSFSRVFSERVGIGPLRYRKQFGRSVN